MSIRSTQIHWLCLLIGILISAGCAKKIQTTQPVALPATAEVGTVTLDVPNPAEATEMGDSSTPAPGAIRARGVIYFDFDSYLLSEAARAILEEQARYLRQQPLLTITLTGHADERGSDSYNLALGAKRARTVQRYLVALGLPEERLTVISYGEEQPADAGHDEAAWAKNRRTELVDGK